MKNPTKKNLLTPAYQEGVDEEANPWKTKEGHLVYENPWIRVTEYQVVNPSGNDGIYGVVSMKNWAVGVIPLDENDYTWLVGQFRYALEEYSWEIPMGGGTKEETLLEAAKRELKEETGLIAEDWEKLIKIHTSNCVTDEMGVAYVARKLSQGETDFDETEELQIKHLPFKEAYQMVLEGKITDSLSVAAILKLGIQMNL